MTLTPEQSSTITRHLAEKVLGWQMASVPVPAGAAWFRPLPDGPPNHDGQMRGFQFFASEFNPLTDPRDTALVMEAWNKRKYASFMLSASASIYRCVISDSQLVASVDHAEHVESWTEAICLAIFRASGGKGI